MGVVTPGMEGTPGVLFSRQPRLRRFQPPPGQVGGTDRAGSAGEKGVCRRGGRAAAEAEFCQQQWLEEGIKAVTVAGSMNNISDVLQLQPLTFQALVKEGLRRVGAVQRRRNGDGGPEGALRQRLGRQASGRRNRPPAAPAAGRPLPRLLVRAVATRPSGGAALCQQRLLCVCVGEVRFCGTAAASAQHAQHKVQGASASGLR